MLENGTHRAVPIKWPHARHSGDSSDFQTWCALGRYACNRKVRKLARLFAEAKRRYPFTLDLATGRAAFDPTSIQSALRRLERNLSEDRESGVPRNRPETVRRSPQR